MQKKLLFDAAQYTRQNHHRRIWQKIVSVMACIVVFCTTYALILPAITMEKPTVCEMEEHTHTVDCYAAVTSEEKKTLQCALASHVHTADCQDEQGNLLCAMSGVILHTHEDACWAEDGTLLCPLEEKEAHTHDESCYESTEEAHVHGEKCYTTFQGELICTLEETEGHAHGDGCTEKELICTLSEEAAHTHSSDCWQQELICQLEETEGHTHGEGCLDENGQTVCILEETAGHTHGTECYKSTLICTLSEEAHTHGDDCYETTTICTLEETAGHTHEDSCYDQSTVLICQIPEGTEQTVERVLTCDEEELAAHAHGDDCYTEYTDESGTVYRTLICEEPVVTEHTHGDSCFLTEQIPVDPEELTCQLEEAEGHTHGEGCLDENGQIVCTLEETAGHTHNELCYGKWELVCELPEHTHTDDCYAELTEEELAQVEAVIEAIDAMPSADEIDEKIAEFEEIEDYEGEEEWLTEVYQQVAEVYQMYTALGEKLQPFVTNADKLLELEYIWSVVTLYDPINSATPDTTWYTSTKDFIELNLYDYNGYVNTNYWVNNTNYPGFQWNGGAYSKNETGYRYYYTLTGIGIPNAVTDRNKVDSIDFGNSLITDLTYGNTSNYVKSVNATDVVKSPSTTSSTGRINWIYGNSTEGYTNKPIGYSTTDASYDDVMSRTLVNGYPALADGTTLDYLFKDGTPAKKMNTESIDGLFQQNEVSGEYNFNSRINHAEYQQSKNFFQLYDEIITPNFILYPFGNFLPLNTISDSTKATQVGAFNYSGGVQDYVERIIADLKSNAEGLGSSWSGTQSQLATMLEEYKENWGLYSRTINGTSNTWTNLSAANAIRDFFWKDTDGGGDGPTTNTGFISDDFLNRMYNIDWDVQTNFFFGMEMKMRFLQPKNGMTGNDTNKDGTPDYPMKFYFTGDDDVWVYIDDVLFLDLSGIHRHVGGEIDFVNGKVNYYALDTATGDVSTTPYKTYTFAEILTNAKMSTDGLNSKGTFKDYTTHSFNFYYTERGSGSSVCRLNFNFPLLRQNSITVEKELTADDATLEALGNPDFMFQILDVDEDGNKTDNSFFAQYDDAGSQWAYTLYDVDGSILQEVKVTEKNDDGTVKTMEVRNAEGKVVRRETQDEDGNAVITNYPENGEVLTIDKNGIFTLKAGQKAEFVGIPENWGPYYVRELIDNIDVGQYGTISIVGSVATERHDIAIDDTTYTGVESPILDMSNGSTVFTIQNQIKMAELVDLSITKKLENDVSDGAAEKTFKMNVLLDGEPVPVGTAYTLTNEDGTAVSPSPTVTTAGVIELKAGQTATISNILSGTRFQVSEDSGSATGYFVGYAQTGAGEVETVEAGGISGVVHVGTNVTVTVTNTENAVEVPIPVTKQYYRYGTIERTSTFRLVQVTDAAGTQEVAATNISSETDGKITVIDQPVTVADLFKLTYLSADEITYDESGKAVFYYRLNESESGGNTIKSDVVYVYEVTVTKDAAGMTAEITNMWTGTGDENGTPTGALTKLDAPETATFTNAIYGPLTISKVVDGSAASKEKEFIFTITLDSTDAGNAPLADSYTGIRTTTAEDGTETEETVVIEFSGETDTLKSGTVTLKHNQRIVLDGIPYQTKWTVEETNPDGMLVTFVVYQGTTEQATETATGWIRRGSANEAKVEFTNTTTYALPQTGGAGTTTYTMAGWMLMLFSGAFLLYRSKKRRREAC